MFKPGDKVKCIKPISEVDPKWNLDPDKIYVVENVLNVLSGSSGSGLGLELVDIFCGVARAPLTYYAKRFQLVESPEEKEKPKEPYRSIFTDKLVY